MLDKIKPFCVYLVHEDPVDEGGIPTEIIQYTWSRNSADSIKAQKDTTRPRGKWIMVLPSNWRWWWDMNCATVYQIEFVGEDQEMVRHPIRWWRRSRLWHGLWRLIRRKRGKGSKG